MYQRFCKECINRRVLLWGLLPLLLCCLLGLLPLLNISTSGLVNYLEPNLRPIALAPTAVPATATAVPATATAVPATATAVPATATAVPATATAVPATATAVPATATATKPLTPTATAIPAAGTTITAPTGNNLSVGAYLRGKCVPNANVEIYEGSTLIGTTVCNAAGDYAFAVPGTLKVGAHDFKAYSIDKDKKRLSESAIARINVVAPQLPVTGGSDE